MGKSEKKGEKGRAKKLRVFSLSVFVLSCDCVPESARISVSRQDETCV